MERVHFSNLKQIGLSPAHFQASLAGRPATPAMRMGSLIHAMVLGGEYKVWEGDRRGNAWKEFESEHDGKLIVTSKEYDQAQGAAMAVMASDPAQRVLEGTQKEQSLEWDWLGRGCAGRLDAVNEKRVVELKTSSTSSPGRFGFHAIRMFYHSQLAWYQRAAGLDISGGDAYIIAVETSAPHAVTVFHLTDDLLACGDRICRVWMERLLSCESENKWPAYVQDIIPLDVPDTDDMSLVIDGEDVAL